MLRQMKHILFSALIISLLCLLCLCASASFTYVERTEGIYTYAVGENEVKIISVSSEVEGELILPNEAF